MSLQKTTLSFTIPVKNKKALDQIARDLDLNRTDVLNEAVSRFLDLHRWQANHIRKGLEESESGEYATEAEVSSFFDQWKNATD